MISDLQGPVAPHPHAHPNLIDTKFSLRWRNYLLQVGCATVFLAITLALVNGLGNLAVVSAIAASAFLAFCVPNSIMNQPRRMLGGHVVALLVTLAISPIGHEVLHSTIAIDVLAAVAVGITMLIMAVTNTEHAPAAGTALGLSLQPWDGEAALSVLVIVLLLIAVHRLGSGRLVDLL